MIRKIKYFFLFLVVLSSCVSSKQSYKEILQENEFSDYEDGLISGFLKKDAVIRTPYGNMIAKSIGFDTGFQYDFCFYDNGVPFRLWLLTSFKVCTDEIEFEIASFSDYEFSYVDFHDNFTIKSCHIKYPVEFKELLIPRNSSLQFNREGELISFVIFDDVAYDGKVYKNGTSFHVSDGEIIFPVYF